MKQSDCLEALLRLYDAETQECSTSLLSSTSTASLPSPPDATKFDFCMCNPPFFSSNLEAWGLEGKRSDDRAEPMSANCGSDVECIVEGGEVEYVKRIIADSVKIKDRIR